MKATLLAADLEELAQIGVDVEAAFSRGASALGRRHLPDRLEQEPGTEAGLVELVDVYAEAYAQMHLVRFAYASKATAYAESKQRYDAVDDVLFNVRRHIVPALRARLAEVRQREDELVKEAEARGIATGDIGPIVPPDRAQSTSLLPGEGPMQRRTLKPLAPRPSRLERLRRALGR